MKVKINGVAMIISKHLIRVAIEYKMKSDRIIDIRLDIRPIPLNLIQVYIPT